MPVQYQDGQREPPRRVRQRSPRSRGHFHASAPERRRKAHTLTASIVPNNRAFVARLRTVACHSCPRSQRHHASSCDPANTSSGECSFFGCQSLPCAARAAGRCDRRGAPLVRGVPAAAPPHRLVRPRGDELRHRGRILGRVPARREITGADERTALTAPLRVVPVRPQRLHLDLLGVAVEFIGRAESHTLWHRRELNARVQNEANGADGEDPAHERAGKGLAPRAPEVASPTGFEGVLIADVCRRLQGPTTRFRPDSFAWYSRSSAMRMIVGLSGVSHSSRTAMPQLDVIAMVMLPK